MKRWFDEFRNAANAVFEQLARELEEDPNWRVMAPSERQRIARNLLLYWIVAPCSLLVVIGLIAWFSNG